MDLLTYCLLIYINLNDIILCCSNVAFDNHNYLMIWWSDEVDIIAMGRICKLHNVIALNVTAGWQRCCLNWTVLSIKHLHRSQFCR